MKHFQIINALYCKKSMYFAMGNLHKSIKYLLKFLSLHMELLRENTHL